ncbi:hypothetical protein NLX83_37230 [Allokutzneria sp. A3M-2-11 16]|uniref:hypothetical protein n=1 Tax=Allokutzneria sp. A3M-2-11 16 TaxID=2962043 RepID=UPI0020B68868|nr:hypothetical protein [Allokutzneria sp. A3M-2-11 16]MCP3804924.1 hypothetical protein [Allokutzneria sp. A3M-2-11 16]
MSLITESADTIKGAVMRVRTAKARLAKSRKQIDQYRSVLVIVHSGSNERMQSAVMQCLLALGQIHAAYKDLVRAEDAMLAYLDACGVSMAADPTVENAMDAAEKTAQTTLSLISNDQTYDPPPIYEEVTVHNPATAEFGPEQVIGQLALTLTLITINCVTKAVQIINARKRR